MKEVNIDREERKDRGGCRKRKLERPSKAIQTSTTEFRYIVNGRRSSKSARARSHEKREWRGSLMVSEILGFFNDGLLTEF